LLEAQKDLNDALVSDDRDSARYWVERNDALLTERAALEATFNPEPSQAKREWVSHRKDLVNPKSIEAAGAWHHHITNRMGIRDDSPEYFELMGHALEPSGYQPMVTPDEVCKMLNLDAGTYNKNVDRLHRLKASGEYPDK
jgi:hypothetical protein